MGGGGGGGGGRGHKEQACANQFVAAEHESVVKRTSSHRSWEGGLGGEGLSEWGGGGGGISRYDLDAVANDSIQLFILFLFIFLSHKGLANFSICLEHMM